MNKDIILQVAIENASCVLGADPTYFGKEGTNEIIKQIKKLGYDCEIVDGFLNIKELSE